MRLNFETRVDSNVSTVKEGFNEALFKKLAPPFPPVRVKRFDGCSKGDLVSLELNFLLFRQLWVSEITEDSTDENEFYFVDEGIQLPFFLKTWSHKHRIIRQGNGAIIRDEISYTGPIRVLTWLLYPTLWLQFAYRKPIYRKVFKNG